MLNSILKSHKDDKEVLDTIISFVKDDKNDDEITFEKLNILIEVFNYYPLIVKKDKNHSGSIY